MPLRDDTLVERVQPFYGSPADFAGLLRLLAEHRVPPPVIDRTFPLDEAAAAHAHLETGTGFGKVVLEIA